MTLVSSPINRFHLFPISGRDGANPERRREIKARTGSFLLCAQIVKNCANVAVFRQNSLSSSKSSFLPSFFLYCRFGLISFGPDLSSCFTLFIFIFPSLSMPVNTRAQNRLNRLVVVLLLRAQRRNQQSSSRKGEEEKKEEEEVRPGWQATNESNDREAIALKKLS